jgi:hypothetical protein
LQCFPGLLNKLASPKDPIEQVLPRLDKPPNSQESIIPNVLSANGPREFDLF